MPFGDVGLQGSALALEKPRRGSTGLGPSSPAPALEISTCALERSLPSDLRESVVFVFERPFSVSHDPESLCKASLPQHEGSQIL